MALVLFRDPVSAMHGKQGDMVFTMKKDQGISRPLVVPRDPQSGGQVNARNILKAVSAAYSALTGSEVAAWETVCASLYERSRITGTRYPFTARSLYQSVNTHRLRAGQSITDTPPASFTTPPTPAIVSVTYTNATKTLAFAIESAAIDYGYWRVRVTPPTISTAAKAQTTNLRTPTVLSSGAYINATSANNDDGFSVVLNDGLASLFHGGTSLQFGLEFVSLSDSYVPNGAVDFRNRVAYTKI